MQHYFNTLTGHMFTGAPRPASPQPKQAMEELLQECRAVLEG